MSSSGEQRLGVQSPGGFARGGTVFRGLQPSEARLRRAGEARLRRAKRGRPAERSEAVPPSEARLHRAKRGSTEAPPSEARAKVIGRSPLQNSKRFHQKAQGNHLFFGRGQCGVPECLHCPKHLKKKKIIIIKKSGNRKY